ncbi:MAG: tRNA 2-thiouridine(34) synthase MnmA [Nannocystaceae bacterium]
MYDEAFLRRHSSVAAALLVEQGLEVVGMTMRLYDARDQPKRSRGGTCCSPAEVDLAQRACELLGIPHYVVDEQERFQRAVIDDFAREYAAGRTPNPCARCNEHVKFGPLLTRARALGAAYMATGHYARIEDGALLRGVDPSKDQSYFLFAMGQETLADVRFPLGDWTKERVRDYARERGMPNWDAPDSQELCFVPDGDHGAVVERRARSLGLDGGSLGDGEVVDETGETLGTHRGIHRVTVGQRRGLGLSSSRPRYVLRVLPEERKVVVGDAEALARTELDVDDFRRLRDLEDGAAIACHVQIRHRSPAQAATLRVTGSRATVTFDAPVRAVAPGQAAVAFLGDQVLGGGWIAGAR